MIFRLFSSTKVYLIISPHKNGWLTTSAEQRKFWKNLGYNVMTQEFGELPDNIKASIGNSLVTHGATPHPYDPSSGGR